MIKLIIVSLCLINLHTTLGTCHPSLEFLHVPPELCISQTNPFPPIIKPDRSANWKSNHLNTDGCVPEQRHRYKSNQSELSKFDFQQCHMNQTTSAVPTFCQFSEWINYIASSILNAMTSDKKVTDKRPVTRRQSLNMTLRNHVANGNLYRLIKNSVASRQPKTR